jgi:hypothetical protein
MSLGSRARLALKADNFTAICEPIARQYGILNISQPYRPSKACYRDSFTLWRRSVLPVRYELDCKYCCK